MFESFFFRTKERYEMVDVYHQVREIVEKSKVQNGTVIVFVPHSTAGITISKNVDESVQKDLLETLNHLVPKKEDYRYFEGNSPAHIKASLMGNQITLIVNNGRIEIGPYQSILFCEFHGPRKRRVLVKVMDNHR